jgi:outer membrane protein insertion porin family
VHILPVKPIFGTHQHLCSPQGSSPVKIKHTSISRTARIQSHVSSYASRPFSLVGRLLLVLALAVCAHTAFAQDQLTIQQIRVIGNRRIPKETILARLFTHVGDTYDPISVERDFNSLWNTAYFDDLRIEREDS